MTMKLQVLLTAVLACAIPMAACDDATRTYDETGSAKTYTYDQRDLFRTDTEREIDRLEARLRDLRARTSAAGEELAADTREQADEIERELKQLRTRLSEAGSATRDGWNDFTRSFSEALDDLGRRIEDAFD